MLTWNNLADLGERGSGAIGVNAIEYIRKLQTTEERATSDFRVAVMSALIKARNERGISREVLAESNCQHIVGNYANPCRELRKSM